MSRDERSITIARKDRSWRCLVAVPRRWRRDEATHCTDRSADRGTKGCTVPTGRGSPDRSPAAGTDQAAPDRSLDRGIWIGASR
jgi:hypothetical protein